MTVIIVDGIDKCGKTTFCNYLLKNLPRSLYLKSGINGGNIKSRKEIFAYYIDLMLILKEYSNSYNIIVDRCYMSEFSYDFKRKKRNQDKYKYENFLLFEKVLARLNAKYIYCFTSFEEIVKKLKLEGDDYCNISDLKKLINNFEEFNKDSLLRIKNYNYLKDKKEDILKWIMK